MSPSDRNTSRRRYERRRFDKWQQRQQAQKVRRRRRVAVAAGACLLAVAVVLGVLALLRGSPTSTVAPGASGGASASTTTGASSVAPCPASVIKPRSPTTGSRAAPAAGLAQRRQWTATIVTTCGEMTADLDGARAPRAVSSFLALAREGYFDGTPCHRLTTGGIFVLQCGDPTGTGSGGPGYSFGPVENAPADDVYPAGTIAMARRANDATSLGSQFFVVYRDSTIGSDSAGGYTVLGRVTSGLAVVQRVAASGSEAGDGAPTVPIGISRLRVAAG